MKSMKRLGQISVALIAIAFLAVSPLGTAASNAQSPVPSIFSGDVAPGGSWPDYSGQPQSASAVVVEGLGSLGCSDYPESNIENATIEWINDGDYVITELTPQTTCGTLSEYESAISSMESYIEDHSSDPGEYWGGFMLDEETGYFPESSLITLTSYTASLMVNAPGYSYFFNEDQPNSFTSSQYNTLVEEGGYQTPQVYSSSMESTVDYECTEYGYCGNIVTECGSCSESPWESWTYAIDEVGGSPDSIDGWGSDYWFNWYGNV